jgi:hypothetical protein
MRIETNKPHNRAVGRHAAPGPYRAVSVTSATECCASARALQGRRFLADEAPDLPLHDCAMPWQCRCRLQAYADRRAVDARRHDDLLERVAWHADDRRLGRGRRWDDWRTHR